METNSSYFTISLFHRVYMEDLIGAIAATLTTVSFVPQVIKVLRTRNTADISLSMYIIFTIGVALWLVYGIMIHRWPMIIANIITFGLTSVILYVKVRSKNIRTLENENIK